MRSAEQVKEKRHETAVVKPTEQLKTEHNAIKLMLKILGAVSDRLEAGEEVDAGHLERMEEFIKIFADKCHHGKEEDLLFVAMEEAGFPRQAGPIGVMLYEHDLGRGYVRGMSQAIARYKAGDRSAASDIVTNARNYVNLLSQHIDKEDNVLYPMADAALSEKKQEQLVCDFERVELERIGPGKHEEFHQLLDYLQGVYLK